MEILVWRSTLQFCRTSCEHKNNGTHLYTETVLVADLLSEILPDLQTPPKRSREPYRPMTAGVHEHFIDSNILTIAYVTYTYRVHNG